MSGRGAIALLALQDFDRRMGEIAQGMPLGGYRIQGVQVVAQVQAPEQRSAWDEHGIGVGESGWDENDSRVMRIGDGLLELLGGIVERNSDSS